MLHYMSFLLCNLYCTILLNYLVALNSFELILCIKNTSTCCNTISRADYFHIQPFLRKSAFTIHFFGQYEIKFSLWRLSVNLNKQDIKAFFEVETLRRVFFLDSQQNKSFFFRRVSFSYTFYANSRHWWKESIEKKRPMQKMLNPSIDCFWNIRIDGMNVPCREAL